MVCDPKCYPITWFCCHKNCPCYESPDFNGIFFTAYNVFTDFNQNLKTTNIISDSSIIRVIYPWSYYHCMAISYFSNVSQQLFSITENCTVLLHAENDTHNLPALHSRGKHWNNLASQYCTCTFSSKLFFHEHFRVIVLLGRTENCVCEERLNDILIDSVKIILYVVFISEKRCAFSLALQLRMKKCFFFSHQIIQLLTIRSLSR